MTRRFIVAATVLFCLAFSGTVAAQKRGGSHGSSHGSSAKSGGTSKPVHVRTYTKKDGTVVEEHDRKAPESKSEGEAAPSLAKVARSTAAGQKAAAAATSTQQEKGTASSSVVHPRSTSAHAKSATHTPPPGTARALSNGIYLYTDPVTGQKTFTNIAPITTPASVPAPAARSATIPPAAPRPTHTSPTRATTRTSTARRSSASGVNRATDGRIARSEAAKHAFEVQNGYPHGRPGYVVDHIKPLACGGADAPSNMQWQTIAAAQAKDKIERVGCR